MKGAPVSGARAFSQSPSPSPSPSLSAHPFLPRTPVVSAVTNSYNLSTMAPPLSPSNVTLWAPDEHMRFLDALEQFGSQHHQQPQATWDAITQSVRTRSLEEVKAHANWYFVELQLVNAQRRSEHLAMQAIDARWTLEEDALFEHLLAVHAGVAEHACYPWELIASELPGKSPRDVQDRYHKLCYDIARIETGHHVSMNLPRFLRARTGAGVAVNDSEATARSWDCFVTLTAEEEATLMRALELVHVSPTAPPQALANIAAAMAVLTNVHNKIPPQRANALFTLGEARAVLEELLQQQQHTDGEQQLRDNQQEREFDERLADPRPVLDVLVRKLRLLPHPGGGGGSGSDNQHERTDLMGSNSNRQLRPLATAGFAFGDAPLPNAAVQFVGPNPKADFSQRGTAADDLLSFRKAQHPGSDLPPFQARSTQPMMFSPTGSGSFSYPPPAMLPSPAFPPHVMPPPHHPPLTSSSRPENSTRSGDRGAGTEEIRASEAPPSPPPPSSSSSSRF